MGWRLVLLKLRAVARPHSRKARAATAATVGITIGAAWASVTCALSDFAVYGAICALICFPVAFGLAAVVVFRVRRFPELVGVGAAMTLSVVAALIAGPSDLFGIFWMMAYGISGAICGPIIGFTLRWIPGLKPD
jgi:hypothetical protein